VLCSNDGEGARIWDFYKVSRKGQKQRHSNESAPGKQRPRRSDELLMRGNCAAYLYLPEAHQSKKTFGDHIDHTLVVKQHTQDRCK